MSTGPNPPAMPAPLDRLARAPVTTFEPPPQRAVTIDPSQFNPEALLAAHHIQLQNLEKGQDEIKAAQEKTDGKIDGLGWKIAWCLAGVIIELLMKGSEFITIKHP